MLRCQTKSPPEPHMHSGHEPETDDSGRSGSARRSRVGRERTRAIMGHSGGASLCSGGSGPRQVYIGGSPSHSSENQA
jgi:hypothetical protein